MASLFHCGYVALIGKPNVGKSTLLNAILGQKIVITSPRPQTTRHSILGIYTTATAQILFLDTPGIHKQAKTQLNRIMNRYADHATYDADVILFLVEALQWQEKDQFALDKLLKVNKPVFLVINFIDKIKNKESLFPYIEDISKKYPFQEIIPISAYHQENVQVLLTQIEKYLPENEAFYDEEQITNRSTRFIVAELIREVLTKDLKQELPYSLTVEVEAFEEKENITVIHAVIWIERSSQKAIILGKRGEKIKALGKQARLNIEEFLATPVYLQLWVKVREGWYDNERMLRSLGYDFE